MCKNWNFDLMDIRRGKILTEKKLAGIPDYFIRLGCSVNVTIVAD
jgi:hypothetical protein